MFDCRAPLEKFGCCSFRFHTQKSSPPARRVCIFTQRNKIVKSHFEQASTICRSRGHRGVLIMTLSLGSSVLAKSSFPARHNCVFILRNTFIQPHFEQASTINHFKGHRGVFMMKFTLGSIILTCSSIRSQVARCNDDNGMVR